MSSLTILLCCWGSLAQWELTHLLSGLMKLLKLLSFSWWITTAKRRCSLSWDFKLDRSSVAMRIRKTCPLPDLDNSTAMAMYAYCPHLENINSSYTLTFALCPVSISSFLLLDRSPFPHPLIFSDFSLSHKSPWQIITLEHHRLSQTCPHPPKKVSSSPLHHILSTCEGGCRERHHLGAELSIMPRGTSARPPPQAEAAAPTNTPPE